MKPTLLLILAITLLTPNLSAQIYEGMQEVSVSYGIESGRQIADGFTQDEDNGAILNLLTRKISLLPINIIVMKRLLLG